MFHRAVQQTSDQGVNVNINSHTQRGEFVPRSKWSVQAICPNCSITCMTRVERKIGNRGWILAIAWCFFGNPCLSLLIIFMDIFKEFIHCCPSCNTIIGVYKPPITGGMIALIILVGCGGIILTIGILVILFLNGIRFN